MIHPTGPLKCTVWFPRRGSICWSARGKNQNQNQKNDGWNSQAGKEQCSARVQECHRVLPRPPPRKESSTLSILKRLYGHLAHFPSRGSYARTTPSATREDRHGNRQGCRWCPDTSRPGRGVSSGPTLSRPPMSLHTTKVSSSRNRSRGLVTRGMSVDPAVGSRAALFNRREQTWSTRSSRRSSSACASLNLTAHAEPPRLTQAPTE